MARSGGRLVGVIAAAALCGCAAGPAPDAAGPVRLASAQTLRAGMPAQIAAGIRETGSVFDVARTGALYQNAPTMFGPDDVSVSEEIAYGPDPAHRLRVYTSRSPRAGSPADVIVLVHGGAFVRGDLRSFATPARQFAGLGFVAVNITYPLAPDHQWPAGPVAVALAMSWARDNAAAWGGDPERLFVLGASAGATHVADYVFRPSVVPEGSPAPVGAILYSPNFLTEPGAPPSYYGEDPGAVADQLLLGRIERVSIPVLTTVAEFDPPPMQRSAAGLYDELVNGHGTPTRLRQLPGHNHYSVQLAIGTADHMFLEEVLDFIAATPARAWGAGG